MLYIYMSQAIIFIIAGNFRGVKFCGFSHNGFSRMASDMATPIYEIEFCGVKFSQIEANLRENFTP